jgi:hypothetical protein
MRHFKAATFTAPTNQAKFAANALKNRKRKVGSRIHEPTLSGTYSQYLSEGTSPVPQRHGFKSANEAKSRPNHQAATQEQVLEAQFLCENCNLTIGSI